HRPRIAGYAADLGRTIAAACAGVSAAGARSAPGAAAVERIRRSAGRRAGRRHARSALAVAAAPGPAGERSGRSPLRGRDRRRRRRPPALRRRRAGRAAAGRRLLPRRLAHRQRPGRQRGARQHRVAGVEVGRAVRRAAAAQPAAGQRRHRAGEPGRGEAVRARRVPREAAARGRRRRRAGVERQLVRRRRGGRSAGPRRPAGGPGAADQGATGALPPHRSRRRGACRPLRAAAHRAERLRAAGLPRRPRRGRAARALRRGPAPRRHARLLPSGSAEAGCTGVRQRAAGRGAGDHRRGPRRSVVPGARRRPDRRRTRRRRIAPGRARNRPARQRPGSSRPRQHQLQYGRWPMSCCSACGKHACACGCGAIAGTPLPLYNRPGLDALAYRVGRYADFRATMQAALSDAALPALAGLRTREADDPAMALLDAWAVGADVLSFYTERIANEAYLRTATERRSVLELARLVDYRLRPGVAASVYLAYTVENGSPPVTIPAGAQAQSIPAPGEQMQTFETAEALDARDEWNALKPRLTQPQNISLETIAGLGELWIAGTASNLKPNDRLLFLFGDLVSGTQAIRLVQSVEVQQQNQRSKVLLQPMDAATVQIVAAANAAIAALEASGTGPNHDEWLRAVEQVRKTLLLGGDNGGSYGQLMKPPFGNDAPPSGPPASDDFRNAVDMAFGVTNPPGGKSGGFAALFGALTLAPTLQPANSLRLQRGVATALGKASDTRPQLLLNFESRLVDTFYRAWTSVPQGAPSPALSGVYAMRVAAPLFGYNAPRIMGLGLNKDPDTKAAVPYVSMPDGDWDTTKVEANPYRVQLDNAYDGVLAGSYLLIQSKDDAVPVVAKAKSVQVHPRSEYGISGKTTDITLDDSATDDGSVVWQVQSMDMLRSTQVHAQSEALTLAEVVITDAVSNVATTDGTPPTTPDSATRLTLDSTVDGLKTGRWLIVTGQRTDVPGTDAVTAAELVMLAAVEQGVDATLPGDTVHSTLVFANQGLAYSYRRDSVAVCANVVRATHGQTRNEVLGSGNGALPMQAFALKQAPLTYVSAATVDGVQSTLGVRVNDMTWRETRNL